MKIIYGISSFIMAFSMFISLTVQLDPENHSDFNWLEFFKIIFYVFIPIEILFLFVAIGVYFIKSSQ